MKTKLLLLAVTLTLVLPLGTQAAAGPFSDVPTTHPYYGAIKYLKDQGFVSGYPDGHYAPDAPISRVEATKIILNAFGIEWQSASTGAADFTDVPKDSWYYPLLNRAVERDIVRGYGNGYFGVNDQITKSQAAKMILKTDGYNDVGEVFFQYFDDVPVRCTDDSSNYAYLAAEKNFIDTKPPNFGINENINRGQFSEFIFRVIYTRDHNLPVYILYKDLDGAQEIKKFGTAFYALFKNCNLMKLDDSSGHKVLTRGEAQRGEGSDCEGEYIVGIYNLYNELLITEQRASKYATYYSTVNYNPNTLVQLSTENAQNMPAGYYNPDKGLYVNNEPFVSLINAIVRTSIPGTEDDGCLEYSAHYNPEGLDKGWVW